MILETIHNLASTLDLAALALPQEGVTADEPTFLGILLRSIFVENILLGRELDDARLRGVLAQCALTDDLQFTGVADGDTGAVGGGAECLGWCRSSSSSGP